MIKKTVLISLALLFFFTLNYNPQMLFKTSYQHWGWNLSLLASVIILLLIRIQNQKNWKQQLGIDFQWKDLISFTVTAVCVLIFAYYLVSYVVSLEGYLFEPQFFNYKKYWSSDVPFSSIISNYLYYIPETFNEEMIIGAMFLFGLERKFKKMNRLTIAIIVALFFSVMHQALYKYSPAQPGITLTFVTLSTLFFVGVLRNVLILKTRKITYSWAIHLSFNLIFFPGFYINKLNGDFTSEPERFNLVFGNWPMFFLTLLIAVLSVFWLIKSKGEQMNQSQNELSVP